MSLCKSGARTFRHAPLRQKQLQSDLHPVKMLIQAILTSFPVVITLTCAVNTLWKCDHVHALPQEDARGRVLRCVSSYVVAARWFIDA